MNIFDKAIATLSPERAVRRARARAILNVVGKRSYAGASTGRRAKGWSRPSTDANSEIRTGGARVRNSARELVRNNAWAASAVGRFTTNAIGPGIQPRSDVEAVNRAWDVWQQQADADGYLTFPGLQALALRSIIESGEVLIQRRTAASPETPFTLKVLEPDHLDQARDIQSLPDGGFVEGGIEYDRNETPQAYWLFPVHPGSNRRGVRSGMDSTRVPADQVLHLFERLRPGQRRGISWFAPVITKLNDLSDYDDAELMRAKIASCFVAFVTDLDGPLGEQTSDDTGEDPEQEGMQPGQTNYLRPGQDVKFGQPTTSTGYSEYIRTHLQAVAVNFGMTYETLTGDLSQVNFSSARMGLLEFRRRIKQVQCLTVIPGMCQPTWRWFLEFSNAPLTTEVQWLLPRYDAIQPLEEANARVVEIRAGLATLQDAIVEDGKDFKQHMEKIAETNTVLDKLDLTLDIDPRKVTKAGIVQVEEDDDPEASAEPPRPASNGDARAH